MKEMGVDYSEIPEIIMKNLSRYVEGKEAPGGFLRAVLCNDLFGAVRKADKEMKPLIALLCQYIHWEVPGSCHGSHEIVVEWMNRNKLWDK